MEFFLLPEEGGGGGGGEGGQTFFIKIRKSFITFINFIHWRGGRNLINVAAKPSLPRT